MTTKCSVFNLFKKIQTNCQQTYHLQQFLFVLLLWNFSNRNMYMNLLLSLLTEMANSLCESID